MKLGTFLQEKGVGYERHEHTVTYTSQQLAQAEHVPGYVVAKPVIVKGAAGFAMCVLPAPKHLEQRWRVMRGRRCCRRSWSPWLTTWTSISRPTSASTR